MITARQNIFELIEKNYNLGREISKINDIFLKLKVGYTDSEGILDISTLYETVDKYYLFDWKNKGTIISIEELEEILEIEDILFNADERSLTSEEALIFLEYMLNIIYICLYSDDYKNGFLKITADGSYEFLMKLVKNLLDYLNHEFRYFEEEEKVLIVQKNAIATEVAEILDEKTALEVIEYNHFLLKGNVIKKRLILKQLADVVEGFTTKENNKGAISDFGYLVNNLNIRHNNLEGTKKQEYLEQMTTEELEFWYDKTYDVFLICVLDNEYKTKIAPEIKKLKQVINRK